MGTSFLPRPEVKRHFACLRSDLSAHPWLCSWFIQDWWKPHRLLFSLFDLPIQALDIPLSIQSQDSLCVIIPQALERVAVCSGREIDEKKEKERKKDLFSTCFHPKPQKKRFQQVPFPGPLPYPNVMKALEIHPGHPFSLQLKIKKSLFTFNKWFLWNENKSLSFIDHSILLLLLTTGWLVLIKLLWIKG